jgi:hypothetical protein
MGKGIILFDGHLADVSLDGLPLLSIGIFDKVNSEAVFNIREGDSFNVLHIASSTALPTYKTGI